jgi:hypothetical protein
MCTPISVLFAGIGQREEWLKGKTKMWDVFLYDMCLESGQRCLVGNVIIYVSKLVVTKY